MSEMITRDEWLAELERVTAHTPGVDGMTTWELRDALGLSRDRLLVGLRAAKASGRLVAGMGVREAIDGRKMRVPVYRIAAARKAPKTPRGAARRV